MENIFGYNKWYETVRLYAFVPYNGGIEKPALSLMDFDKTIVLYTASEVDAEHPETQNLPLSFDLYDQASYDGYDANGNGIVAYELERRFTIFSCATMRTKSTNAETALWNFRCPIFLRISSIPRPNELSKIALRAKRHTAECPSTA